MGRVTSRGRFGNYRTAIIPTTPLIPVRRAFASVRLSPATAQPLSPVTFPTTDLRSRVQIALGADVTADPSEWLWEDITEFVRWEQRVRIIRQGREDEGSVVGPGAAMLTLDNRDGRFSRRNPSSPYFGLLSKNTPIWAAVDPGDGMHTRLEAYVNAWPNRWDRSANDCTIPIEVAGILRRLLAGSRTKSPLRRTILASNPVAYWTMEDSATSTTFRSAVTGGSPLKVFSGSVTFAAYTDLGGATTTPDLTLAYLIGNVSGGSATAWHVEFVAKAGIISPTTVVRAFTKSATHTVFRFSLPGFEGGLPSLLVTDPSGGVTSAPSGSTAPDPFTDTWHHYAFTAEQSGSNVVCSVWCDGVFGGSETNAGTLAAVYQITVNPNLVSLTSLAHLAVGDGATPAVQAASGILAVDGYFGEQAHTRIRRNCIEEGIPFYSVASSSVAMGVQPAGSVLAVIREGEAADHGVIYEKAFGLAYQSRDERENQPVALTLDFAQFDIAEEPRPTDDDQRTRNLWTVNGSTSGEATYELTTGPMGTGSEGPGLYDDSTTVNVESEDDLPYQASYLVNQGTVDEDRWPQLDIGMHRTPHLIDDWTSLSYGARMHATNPLQQVAPDTIDAIIAGHSEAWDSKRWDVSIYTEPNAANRVFRLSESTGDSHEFLGYLVPTSCVLAEDLDTTETDVDVTTTGPLWSTNAENWTPGALVVVGGETMLVTGVSGASNPQTLTVTRSINGEVKAHTAGAALEFVAPGALGLK